MAQSIYAISFPVTTGDVVKQGHADYCRDNGHATWEEDGVDKGVCPRCGTVTRGYDAGNVRPIPGNPIPVHMLTVGLPVRFYGTGRLAHKLSPVGEIQGDDCERALVRMASGNVLTIPVSRLVFA